MQTYPRYQNLVFPDGIVIPKSANPDIPDCTKKLATLGFPEDFSGKTFLDVGCAEGFFVIEAVRRGATLAQGCDLLPERIQNAQIVARAWGFGDRTRFTACRLSEIPASWRSDYVACLAVAHHLHGGDHDTWSIISNPRAHRIAFQNLLRAVGSVADLTREISFWEYSFEYATSRPAEVDHELLGKIWVEEGLYEKVELVNVLETREVKDRAFLRAYKRIPEESSS